MAFLACSVFSVSSTGGSAYWLAYLKYMLVRIRTDNDPEKGI